MQKMEREREKYIIGNEDGETFSKSIYLNVIETSLQAASSAATNLDIYFICVDVVVAVAIVIAVIHVKNTLNLHFSFALHIIPNAMQSFPSDYHHAVKTSQ